jgi:hypothetical protein
VQSGEGKMVVFGGWDGEDLKGVWEFKPDLEGEMEKVGEMEMADFFLVNGYEEVIVEEKIEFKFFGRKAVHKY